jgi:hypothetical protein
MPGDEPSGGAADQPACARGGVCLNTSALEENEATRLCGRTEDQLGLPCTDPFRLGVESIIDELLCLAPSARSTIASR